jgi:hypothetical protein
MGYVIRALYQATFFDDKVGEKGGGEFWKTLPFVARRSGVRMRGETAVALVIRTMKPKKGGNHDDGNGNLEADVH